MQQAQMDADCTRLGWPLGYNTVKDDCSRMADAAADGGCNNKKDGNMPRVLQQGWRL